MQAQSYTKSISQLSREIQRRKYLLDHFIKKLNNEKSSSNEIVYSFQALMDGLIFLKERADTLTLPLDHG